MGREGPCVQITPGIRRYCMYITARSLTRSLAHPPTRVQSVFGVFVAWNCHVNIFSLVPFRYVLWRYFGVLVVCFFFFVCM